MLVYVSIHSLLKNFIKRDNSSFSGTWGQIPKEVFYVALKSFQNSTKTLQEIETFKCEQIKIQSLD